MLFSHSVIQVHVDADLPLRSVLELKHKIEEELHHYHHMQTAVVDIHSD